MNIKLNSKLNIFNKLGTILSNVLYDVVVDIGKEYIIRIGLRIDVIKNGDEDIKESIKWNKIYINVIFVSQDSPLYANTIVISDKYNNILIEVKINLKVFEEFMCSKEEERKVRKQEKVKKVCW